MYVENTYMEFCSVGTDYWYSANTDHSRKKTVSILTIYIKHTDTARNFNHWPNLKENLIS
jgi:hypothetical protein